MSAPAWPRAHGSARRWRLGPEGRKLAAGVLLMVLVLWGQGLYGWATAGQRLDPALRGATGPSNVVVVLGFTPDRFHSERIREHGAFAGRDGRSTACACAMSIPTTCAVSPISPGSRASSR